METEKERRPWSDVLQAQRDHRYKHRYLYPANLSITIDVSEESRKQTPVSYPTWLFLLVEHSKNASLAKTTLLGLRIVSATILDNHRSNKSHRTELPVITSIPVGRALVQKVCILVQIHRIVRAYPHQKHRDVLCVKIPLYTQCSL